MTIPFSQSGFVASFAKSPPNRELYLLPFVAPLLRFFLMFVPGTVQPRALVPGRPGTLQAGGDPGRGENRI